MRHAERGVSLIELIMAIVVASAGIAIVSHGLVTSSRSIDTDDEIQGANAYASACAAHLLGRRRQPWVNATLSSFSVIAAATASTLCSSILPTLAGSGYARNLNIVDVTTGQSPACPSTIAGFCRRIDITVTAPSGYVAGMSFLVVHY